MARSIKRQLLLLSRTVHIYLSILGLLTIFFFASTGFMLNHPQWFNLDAARSSDRNTIVPDTVASGSDKLALVEYLRASEAARGEMTKYDQQEDTTDIYFTGPGRTMQFTISHATGDTAVHVETRNALAWLTDLHQAKHTGRWWPRVVDATAILLILVSLTGLILWLSLAKRRTIGLIALGVSVIAVVGVLIFLLP